MPQLAEAFAFGVLSAATPCLLPLYPGFIAFTAANGPSLAGRRAMALLGLAVVLGVLATVVVVGMAVTLLAAPLGAVLVVLVPAADALVVVLGVLLVVGRNVFDRLPGVVVPAGGSAIRRAFAYGLLFGPLAVPCAGPFLVALLAVSLGPGDAAGALATFVAFGLGAGLPLIALSIVSAARGQAVARAIAARRGAIERVAGVLLVVAGVSDLVVSWPALLAAFASGALRSG